MYRKLIMDATGVSLETAAQVEDIMRNVIFRSTLDWQTAAQLKRAARQAVKVLNEMRERGQ